MPLGARATVVGVEEPLIDILLDTTIVSGNTLGRRCSDFRGYHVKFESLLNLSDKPSHASKSTKSQFAGWQGSQQTPYDGTAPWLAG